MGQIGRVRRILRRWSGEKADIAGQAAEPERRTHPHASMNLVLRFVTEAGPRTVIASGIPLALASDIAREMEKGGHHAQFVDRLPNLSVAERVKLLKGEKLLAAKRKLSALAVVRDQAIAG